ncbi:DUF2721 domain-containing protein [Sphingomonas rhizophila]|uniref:DUF2721 domain-containing protein n=1 Tax=Sphingomonas rhizophila TaxID=2071607 RepID=A0A7G9SBE4_9SPHN|nr:DUF2721 domain-containing protein [Sphingomonas rhizophila]QNN65169.1 DUF2721 domain-containing protein [Sphingomonas rhizophila]
MEPSILPHAPDLGRLATIISQAVAPVFLLAGVGAFLNVTTGRLARIVDRARQLEPRLLASRGPEHDRLVGEIRLLDRRMRLVSRTVFFSVLSALLICAVVVLLFAAFLTGWALGTAVALLFIAAMIAVGAAFAIFLHETQLAGRAVRIRSEVLMHQADDAE